MDVIKGFVEHIIYRNAENGYTVLNLIVGEDEITCVGFFGTMDQGETIEAEGNFTTHNVYGEQFKIEHYKIVPPDDVVSIERYLGSGAIKGVGEALAARIVKRFGTDTYRIIEEEPERLEYHEPEGIIGFIRDMNKSTEAVCDVIYFKGESEGISVEGAFQYINEFHENVLGFCNNIYNSEGGTHLTGFKTAFTNIINTYARELNILKDKDANFTGADVRNGMTAVISVKHPDPRFEGQTKTKLDNQDAAKVVSKVTGEEVVRYFDRNLETLKSVIGCAEKAAKIRKSEEKAKTNMLTKQKFSFDSNGKLANCESRDPSKCEIFIVEGDSAGGSAKTARDRNYQAILPIRGKILNVEKASIDKVLANAEIKTMINAFGCGFSEGYGNDFDISRLRYDKIIIMADADVDGEHISTLLLTLFYRFMPELIYEGHVYIAMPPLYKVMPSKGAEEYLYDDKALEKYRKRHKGSFTLQRYKGLGEMDAEQLWETTLDPDTRLLKQVEIEDARMATEVTEMLMGTEVLPRREFIYRHAQDAELDI